jgi:5-methyltetrahydrofolate--homocysteine methyltransferase
MRENILKSLASSDVIVGDGAVGTTLQGRGLAPGAMPELWTLERPDEIRAMHRAYLDAGAQFLTTNTFGGNRLRLAQAGLADGLSEINQRGVAIAREVAQDSAWVAASVGPTGQLLEPWGDLSVAEAEEVYAEQIVALAEAGADFIKIETMNAIEEALCAVRMAVRHTQLPVFCSFAFDERGRTLMGVRAADAAQQAVAEGASVLGANCGAGPAAVAVAILAMSRAVTAPLLAQANAGIPQAGAHAATHWDVTPEQMGRHARDFVAAGAHLVAGCCGTTPTHIAAMVKALHQPKGT